jgi:type IV pilus assembly protein PilY1
MMSNRSNFRSYAAAVAAVVAALLAAPAAQAAQTALADQPIFTSITVPGNVALTLSVEYPTATSIANGIVNYSSATTYYGYFDPTKCYQYNLKGTKTAGPSYGSYFTSYGAANSSDFSCSGASSKYLFSGNFLNWASMSTIDPFRFTLTGGYRSVDASNLTILEKAWAPPNQGSATESPPQATSQTTYPNITPFSWSTINTNVFHMGQYLCFTGNSGAVSTSNGTLGSATYTTASTNWSGTLSGATEYNPGTTVIDNTNVFCVETRVDACDASQRGGVEGYCTLYSSGYYKPEGLIQKYAQQMRFATFGYLLDSAASGNIGVRDGGVMRARMEYVGPIAPVPGAASVTNPNSEWSSTTGQFVANPDPTDVTSTLAATGCSGCNVPNSGTVNYLNGFGEHARSLGHSVGYKGYDNVSELYYTALRYFKEVGSASNTNLKAHEYTDLTATTTTLASSDCVTAGADQCVDGFPVITETNWYPTDASAPRGADYPIQYYCQKNFIIGIGDENTHQDGNLPGNTTMAADGYEPPTEAAVSGDTTLNGTANASVTTSNLTTWIGTQEGTVNGDSVASTGALGTTSWTSYGACCGGATFDIAGLAYDAHVNDMLPNAFKNADGSKPATQTLSTYWVDVLEYGQFRDQNQYWLAAKYGGFTVPASYTEFSVPTDTSGTAWGQTLWAPTGRTVANGSTNYLVPDNYYSGRDSAAMKQGLTNAFAQIASSISANSTALSLASPKISSTGTVSYSTTYNQSDWTGSAVATTITFDTSGNIVLTPTAWNAQSALQTLAAGTGWNTTRIIATCCSSTGGAVPFRQTSLGSTYLANLAGTATLQANVINYLRGDRSNEGTSGTAAYRVRDYLLGDIVDAQAVPVGPPSAPLSSVYNPGYSAFASKYFNRKTVVYVGANDGMMHAFDGTILDPTVGGNELFAYVPSAIYAGPGAGPGTTATPATNGLVSRTSPTFAHYNFVDATPAEGDVDFGDAGVATPGTVNWHSILVGGLGKGGASYYAIDVTDPTAWTSETAVAGKVLWEFTNTNLGYTFGPPVITKTAQYGWVVILTSGYNNVDGKGRFFIVNPQTGALLQTVTTTAGTATTPSGLAFASTYVPNYATGVADSIYAGDLLGNVWRVDLTPTTGAFPVKLIAQATDGSGKAQPITTRPLIEQSGSGSAYRFVVFGTGRMLAPSDITNSQTNSIYVIYDGLAASGGFLAAPNIGTYPVERNATPNQQLIQDTNITSATATSSVAITNQIANAAPPTSMGYYFDLTTTAIPGLTAPPTGYAYQVDVQSSANNGLVAFGINAPSGSACSPAGVGAVLAFGIAGSSAGQSALATSYGGAYMATSQVGDVTFYNNNGTGVGIAAGVQNPNDTNPIKQPTCPGCTPTSTIQKLNWREIPGAN